MCRRFQELRVHSQDSCGPLLRLQEGKSLGGHNTNPNAAVEEGDEEDEYSWSWQEESWEKYPLQAYPAAS